jgi:hypothetical protein
MNQDGWLTEVLRDAADRVSQWSEWEKPEMLRVSASSPVENNPGTTPERADSE